ncbi:MAG: hypothetical protein RMJ37_05515 [Spirochaetia bacterium]|nr:hypothetical protein [Spirochaetota bacterium]MDW8112775.1 hypothetical protein [Spirochaetia bacterium]
MLLLIFGLLVASVVQREYYKSLCKEEENLKKKLIYLKNEHNKLVWEIERITTLERLIGKEPSKYRVSMNRVIVIDDE